MTLLPRLITGLTNRAVGVYYRLEHSGPPVPAGPVLVTANHPNALLDPLVIFRIAGRVVRPLAKAPLFRQALIGTVLRGLGGLPVYRRQDQQDLMHLNEDTFDAAIAALHRGEAVQIFPEGQSHSEPSLTPLRTGAARIALQAEARAGWKLGLHVVPVGLTYMRKHRFRGRVLATVGRPFSVVRWRDAFEADAHEAAQQVTQEIAARLEEVTLNLESEADRDLVEVAERLYARGKGWVGWRERDPLGERLPRLKAFARGVAWLRAHDPSRHDELVAAVEQYRRLLALFGAREGDVPPRYRAGSVALYAVRQLGLLILLAPAAALGVLAWWIPYRVPGIVVASVRPKLDSVSTYLLGTALLAFPVVWVGWTLLAGLVGSLGWAVAVALFLPVAGLAAVGFVERYRRVREDVRVFLRASRHGRGRDRLAAVRGRLVERFDEVAAEMAGERSDT